MARTSLPRCRRCGGRFWVLDDEGLGATCLPCGEPRVRPPTLPRVDPRLLPGRYEMTAGDLEQLPLPPEAVIACRGGDLAAELR